ncbi:MAG: peptidylprolyl isomerase [Tateyamaria sp.]|jgi:peptidylprolyl isomerase|nr:peptidylprolyl isomerase [Tateyamaria sp.]
MHKLLATLLALVSGPVLASGIEITVAGEAKGVIAIDLYEDIAPGHAERITTLAAEGSYDGVAFHRVIDGFMAQTGDVKYGNIDEYGGRFVGTGQSDYANLPAEFSDETFARGTVGMARSSQLDSANSQFFIMFAPGDFLDGQYTIVGKVTSGLEVLDAIKRGNSRSGSITGAPDFMKSVTVTD